MVIIRWYISDTLFTIWCNNIPAGGNAVMKSTIKRLLVTSLSAASILAVTSSALADDNSTAANPGTSDSNPPIIQLGDENITDGGIVTPFSSTPVIDNRPISGHDYEASFYIKPNFGYVRLYLKNTGPDTINLSVNQGSTSGPLKYFAKVYPGQTFNEILNPKGAWAVGDFYVSLASGSLPMSGQLGVRISTDLNF